MKKTIITAALLMVASSVSASEKIEMPDNKALTELMEMAYCPSGYEPEVSFYKKAEYVKNVVDLASNEIKSSTVEYLDCQENETAIGSFCIIALCVNTPTDNE
ncbi:TPA: hypothetical protein ACVO4S_001846 [Vibrio diabolicus]